jgi:hypothetical protein
MVKYVTYGAEAAEIDRPLGVVFEVSAEANDKIIHSAGSDDPGVSPTDFQELLPGERFAPTGDKKSQQFHFLFGQGDLAVFDVSCGGTEIDPVVPENVSLGR